MGSRPDPNAQLGPLRAWLRHWKHTEFHRRRKRGDASQHHSLCPSSGDRRAWPKQPCWGRVREGSSPPAVGVRCGGVTPGKKLGNSSCKFLLSAWRTFSQTINSCKSAKYHTFPYSRLHYVHPARGNTKERAGLQWDARHIGHETGRPGKHGTGNSRRNTGRM